MTARKVAVTLPEPLYDMVERARDVEHRSRSEVVQEALRQYFGESVYRTSPEEKRLLDEVFHGREVHGDRTRDWPDVRDNIRSQL